MFKHHQRKVVGCAGGCQEEVGGVMETYKIKFEFVDGAPVFTDDQDSSRNLNIIYGWEDPRVRPGYYDIEYSFVVYVEEKNGAWHADWIAEDWTKREVYRDRQPGLDEFVHRVNRAIETSTSFEFSSDEDCFKDFQGMMFWACYVYGKEISSQNPGFF